MNNSLLKQILSEYELKRKKAVMKTAKRTKYQEGN